MIDSLRSKFEAAAKRLADEPVMLATAAIIGLQAFIEASNASLEGQDLIFYIAQAVIGFLARSNVWPSSKVITDGAVAIAVEELPEPVLLGVDDDPQ